MKLAATAGVAIVGVAALGGIYAATRDAPAAPVATLAQAEAALAALYDAREDAAALCELGTSVGNCRALLDDAGDAPEAAPAIVCSVEYPGDSTHTAGLIVRIHTDEPSPDTEALVLNLDGDARYMNPVYWNGSRVSNEGVATPGAEYACE